MTNRVRGLFAHVAQAIDEPVPMRSHVIAQRAAALTAATLGWAAFLGIGFWATFAFNPAKGQFAPQWVGFALLGLIAIALAGGAAASRLKLGETIMTIYGAGFQIGYETCQQRMAEKAADRAAATVLHETGAPPPPPNVTPPPGVMGGRRIR